MRLIILLLVLFGAIKVFKIYKANAMESNSPEFEVINLEKASVLGGQNIGEMDNEPCKLDSESTDLQEGIESPNIFERDYLYEQEGGSSYFIEDGRNFLNIEFIPQELNNWAFVLGASHFYREFWSETESKEALTFLKELLKSLEERYPETHINLSNDKKLTILIEDSLRRIYSIIRGKETL